MVTKSTIIFAIMLSISCFANASRLVYDIEISLANQNGVNKLDRLSGAQLEVSNIGTAQALDFIVVTSRKTLLEYSSQDDCEACYFLIQFIPKDKKYRSFRTIIDYEFINDQVFEDFIEVYLNENSEINGFKYGIVQYGVSSRETTVLQVTPKDPWASGDIFEEVRSYNQPQGTPGADPVGGEPEKPEEKSFFQRYFWWIIIGGFVVFQFLTVDKEKLNEAMNQAQNQAQPRR